jgi:hypothetical protein
MYNDTGNGNGKGLGSGEDVCKRPPNVDGFGVSGNNSAIYPDALPVKEAAKYHIKAMIEEWIKEVESGARTIFNFMDDCSAIVDAPECIYLQLGFSEDEMIDMCDDLNALVDEIVDNLIDKLKK